MFEMVTGCFLPTDLSTLWSGFQRSSPKSTRQPTRNSWRLCKTSWMRRSQLPMLWKRLERPQPRLLRTSLVQPELALLLRLIGQDPLHGTSAKGSLLPQSVLLISRINTRYLSYEIAVFFFNVVLIPKVQNSFSCILKVVYIEFAQDWCNGSTCTGTEVASCGDNPWQSLVGQSDRKSSWAVAWRTLRI